MDSGGPGSDHGGASLLPRSAASDGRLRDSQWAGDRPVRRGRVLKRRVGSLRPRRGAAKRSADRDSEATRARRERRPSEASVPGRSQRPHQTYDQAFPALAGIYLEDSWVLDVQADAGRLVFQLDAVLTPEHPAYRPPVPGQHHCYRTGHLVIHCPVPVALERSTQRPARDATGELDFGHIDAFVPDDDTGASTWRLDGDWGTTVVTDPDVAVYLEN